MTDPPVALAHDSQRFDGHRLHCLSWAAALAASGTTSRLYTCVDPSLGARYEVDGTAIVGRRVPLGGTLEMGVNRWGGVFARRLERIPESPLHVNSIHLAGATRRRRDVVVTIADLAKRTTRYYPRGSSWVHNRLLSYLPRAAAVVTLSEWVRQDVARVTGYPLDRIVAAPPPPRVEVRAEPADRAPPSVDHPWTLLYIATDRPHKNVRGFLEILARSDRRFVGEYIGAATPATRAYAHQLGLDSRLTVRREVADIGAVYDRAAILLFPSRYEGFGLPLLEAMARGVPVVSSNATCLPEVVGGAGPLLSPDDRAGWDDAIDRLTDPDVYRLAQLAALERSRTFTAERAAGGLRRAYALAERGRR